MMRKTIAGASNILMVHPSVPAKNFKEFITYTKANPGKVNFEVDQGGQGFRCQA